MKLIDHIDTCPNPKGLCSLNTEGEITILACPDKVVGSVNIHLYGLLFFFSLIFMYLIIFFENIIRRKKNNIDKSSSIFIKLP